MKKEAESNNSRVLKLNKELRQQYTSPLIKWWEATMSMDEKYRFGMISYQEYAQWKAEHPDEEPEEEEEKLEETAEATEGGEDSEKPVNHTFWEDDDGDRENLSADAFADFLAANNLDIGNKNSIDIAAIQSAANTDS